MTHSLRHSLRLFTIASALLVSSLVAAHAEDDSCATPGNNNQFLGIRTVRLWPGDAPEAKGKACEDIPTLTILDPQFGRDNGSAVIVLPGGGYNGLAGNLEGRQVADWFTARGFRAFILQYRLPHNGYLLPIPLMDARRAVQTVRGRARDYFIAPNRIVIVGFSAGGHLAALAATQFVPGNPEAEDPIERASSRPDYLVLGYPWIGAITADTSIISYCGSFHLMDQCDALKAKYSPDLSVTRDTPPTFWYHTFNDETVPLDQGMRFYEALIKAGVQSEAHVFASGPHGTGLGAGDPALDQWPNLLENWLRRYGLLTRDDSVAQPKPNWMK